MTTIVTGFIDLYAYDEVKRCSSRSVDKYFEEGEHILRSECNKIVFIERKFEERVKPFENEHTTIVYFEKEDMWQWNQRNDILTHELPRSINSCKDTRDYMMTMATKTQWMKEAILRNPYNTDNFVWIDFGIHMMISNSFPDLLKHISKTQYKKLRIAGCWILLMDVEYDMMEWIYWYFCGCVFGGHKDAILLFHEYCVESYQTLFEKKQFTWEVNVWYDVYRKHPDIFEWYHANHDFTCLLHY